MSGSYTEAYQRGVEETPALASITNFNLISSHGSASPFLALQNRLEYNISLME
jgi:hypothetical protein